MSYRQEVECPQCKHKHFVQMELADLYHKRNQSLEEAFRELFAICVKQVPIGKAADTGG